MFASYEFELKFILHSYETHFSSKSVGSILYFSKIRGFCWTNGTHDYYTPDCLKMVNTVHLVKPSYAYSYHTSVFHHIPSVGSKGAFNNHVDIILVFWNHPPTPPRHFYVLNVDKNGHF